MGKSLAFADLIATLDGLGSPQVAVIGDLILDHYVMGNVERISPEAPIPVLHVRTEQDRLGGAANVAANVISMGGKAALIGALGKDEPGERFNALAEKTRGLKLMPAEIAGRPTVLKTRMVSQNQQMLRVDRENNTPLDASSAATILKQAAKAVSGARALVLSDYNKGVITKESAQAYIKLAREHGIPVIVDPKGRDYSRYKGAAAVTPNRAEAEAATGMDAKSMAGVEKAGRDLVARLGLEAAVITLSADGVAVVPKKGELVHFPAQARGVFDVTGAGDTFIACFAVCVAAGVDYFTAAKLANQAGGLKVARFGAVAISREELRRAVVSAHEGFDHVGKVVNHAELVKALEVHRAHGEKIVFTNGCFDLLHQGHVTYLNYCKGLGDIVVVGINSDESVKRLKGPTRPLNGIEARARVLAALADVAYVTGFEDDTPEELIRKVSPDVLVKGADWEGKEVAGQKFVESKGGKVVFAPLVKGVSTTNLIAKANQSPVRKRRGQSGTQA